MQTMTEQSNEDERPWQPMSTVPKNHPRGNNPMVQLKDALTGAVTTAHWWPGVEPPPGWYTAHGDWLTGDPRQYSGWRWPKGEESKQQKDDAWQPMSTVPREKTSPERLVELQLREGGLARRYWSDKSWRGENNLSVAIDDSPYAGWRWPAGEEPPRGIDSEEIRRTVEPPRDGTPIWLQDSGGTWNIAFYDTKVARTGDPFVWTLLDSFAGSPTTRLHEVGGVGPIPSCLNRYREADCAGWLPLPEPNALAQPTPGVPDDEPDGMIGLVAEIKALRADKEILDWLLSRRIRWGIVTDPDETNAEDWSWADYRTREEILVAMKGEHDEQPVEQPPEPDGEPEPVARPTERGLAGHIESLDERLAKLEQAQHEHEDAEFDETEERLAKLEQTVSQMASHVDLLGRNVKAWGDNVADNVRPRLDKLEQALGQQKDEAPAHSAPGPYLPDGRSLLIDRLRADIKEVRTERFEVWRNLAQERARKEWLRKMVLEGRAVQGPADLSDAAIDAAMEEQSNG